MQTVGRARQIPALDGLRALAVGAVFGLHAGLRTYGGQTGVYVFFALSGYLITSLLLQEQDRHGAILLGNFYLRRVLRLYPALIAVVLAIALYAVCIPDAVRGGESLRAIPAVLFYAANWVRAVAPVGGHPLGLLEHTWSLAVEEQFYLLWPLVVALLVRLGQRASAVAWTAAGGAVVSLALVLTAPAGAGGHLLYNGLHTNAGFLLLGAAGAAFAAGASTRQLDMGRLLLRWAFTPAALALVIAVFTLRTDAGETFWYRASVVGVAVACAVAVLAVALNPRLWASRVLAIRWLVFAGRRSYAFYLWHYPVLLMLRTPGSPWIGRLSTYEYALVAFALSVGLSVLSHRFFEAPFLRVKDRLAERERETGAVAAS